MTQLIVSLEDTSMLNSVKAAIRLLRGVSSVKLLKDEKPNRLTVKAMAEAENGDTIACANMEEYLKLVGDGIQS